MENQISTNNEKAKAIWSLALTFLADHYKVGEYDILLQLSDNSTVIQKDLAYLLKEAIGKIESN